MTRDDSEWVNSLFAASAGDWTPAAANDAAHVLYAPVSRDPEASWRCASVLSHIELQRAERFVTEDGKAHFRQRRAFRRYCGALVLGFTGALIADSIPGDRERASLPSRFAKCLV